MVLFIIMRKQQVHSLLQAGCSAMRNFADTALMLEQDRISASRSCRGALRDCGKHQEVMDKIRTAEDEMLSRLSANLPIF